MSEQAPDNCVLQHTSEIVLQNSVDLIDCCQGLGNETGQILDKGQEMGPLATKIEPNDKSLQDATYYGIHIPGDIQSKESNEDVHVYLDKIEALKMVKKHKKARFKIFKSKQEAVEFALHGLDITTVVSPSEHCENTDQGSPVVGEKPSLFKGPKAQDMVQLRKAIEYGDLQTVKSTVWNNPRYLVSSGDTPSILQEGSRYNALHVAAKARNTAMSEFIIQTVGDPTFVSLLYGDDDQVSCEERAAILLDLYLNTPDKGLNETPLHFAVKFGAVRVVEDLVNCIQCDKNPKNKFGQTPKDIICSRVSTPDPVLKKEIMNLLQERYYVPVLRSEDNSVQPTVGIPFQPSSPPILNENPLSPRLDIYAFAGPMNNEEAVVFRKKWRTPPRLSTPHLSPALRLQDTEKGLERVGRNLAQEFNVNWKEYWPFLDCFTDLSTPEGLELLEKHLKDRHLQVHSFIDLGSKKREDSGAVLNISTCSTASSIGDGAVSPMTDLCRAFKACTLSDEDIKTVTTAKKYRKNILHDLRSGDSFGDNETLFNVLSNPALSPLLYVEKSCQVFAKRISDYLIYMVENVQDLHTNELVLDQLSAEIKHLKGLVNSYMDDDRFISVDFQFLHSRISMIVAYKLSRLSNMDADLLIQGLKSLELHPRIVEPGSSDEDVSNTSDTMYRTQRILSSSKGADALVQQQIQCISHHIYNTLLKLLDNSEEKHPELEGRVDTEADCEKVWSDVVKCSCVWQNFTRGSRKNASLKRSHSLKKAAIVDHRHCLETKTLLNCATKKLKVNDISDSRDAVEYGTIDTDFEDRRPSNSEGYSTPGQFNDIGESEASDSDDGDSFCTACSSPRDLLSDEEMLSADEGVDVYFEGDAPSKMDLSVLQAIEGCNITPDTHPNLFWWRCLVLQHSESERNRWGSPSTMRRQQRRKAASASRCQNQKEVSSPNAWHRVAGRYTPHKQNCYRD